MKSVFKFSLITLFSTLIFGNQIAIAQEPQMQQQTVEITDAALQSFAAVNLELEKIRDEYTIKLSNAENQEQAQKLQMEAQNKMAEKVESSGLSIAGYNQIVRQVQANPEVQKRLENL